LYFPIKQRKKANTVRRSILEVTKLMDYVDSREDRLIQIVRTRQINTNSAMFQAAISLKRELRRETMLIKGITAEMIRER
jgi:hypothetical protein